MNFSPVPIQYSDMDMQGEERKNTRGFFRPFHQADIAGIQAVFHSRPEGFFLIVEPVKVDMENLSVRINIFIDDGKGRASNGAAYLFGIA